MESSFFHRLTTCEVSVWNLWPVKKHWLSTWQRYKLPITNHNAMGADTIGACEVTATVRTLGISTPPKFLMLLCRPPSSTPCPLKLLMDFLSLETSVHFREFRKESRLQNELYSTRYAGSLAFFTPWFWDSSMSLCLPVVCSFSRLGSPSVIWMRTLFCLSVLGLLVVESFPILGHYRRQ